MKIGLLNACTPAEEIEFKADEYVNFRNFLDLAPNQIELINYRITEMDFPAEPTECAGYIITGSPRGVYDPQPWIATLGDFIRTAHAAEVKLVGICFGHQILAHSLGGHAEKSDKGWGMGLHAFDLEREKRPEWLTPPADSDGCSLYFCHQDQVITLPKSATRLAGNEFCPNAMFEIKDRVLAMQGHPEFTDKTMVDTIGYFRGKLDDSFVDGVASTLETDSSPDSPAAAEWIVAFLQQ